MLIAIENKLGLKYFAGAREDHTRKFFDGINNYPHKELDVKTFGKEELTNLFNDCGIGVQQFYYPHPDYKIPKVVYSDSFLPGVHTTIPKSHLPSPNFDQPREFLFSEQQFALSLEKNKIFDKFANSFLVEGVKGEVSNQSGEVVFGQTSPNRGASYKIRTTAYELNKSGHIRFKKEALTKEAIPHIQKMFTTYRKLTDILTQNKLIRVAQPLESIDGKSAVEFDFIKGQSAEDLLLHAILEDKLDEASEIIKKFTSIIQSLSQNVSEKPIGKNFSKYFGSNEVSKFNHKEVVTSGLLDLNLDNFIIDEKDKSWWLIDYEWRLDVPIPLELVKYRSLFYFFSRHSSMIRSRCDKFDVLQNNILALPKALTEDNLVDPQKINLAYIIEHKYLQPAIFGTKIQQPRPSKYDRAIQEQYYDIDAKEQRLSQLEGDNQNLRESVEQLEKHINQIRASKAYRVASKVARAKKKLIK